MAEGLAPKCPTAKVPTLEGLAVELSALECPTVDPPNPEYPPDEGSVGECPVNGLAFSPPESLCMAK